jgi:hypothetical protein
MYLINVQRFHNVKAAAMNAWKSIERAGRHYYYYCAIIDPFDRHYPCFTTNLYLSFGGLNINFELTGAIYSS